MTSVSQKVSSWGSLDQPAIKFPRAISTKTKYLLMGKPVAKQYNATII